MIISNKLYPRCAKILLKLPKKRTFIESRTFPSQWHHLILSIFFYHMYGYRLPWIKRRTQQCHNTVYTRTKWWHSKRAELRIIVRHHTVYHQLEFSPFLSTLFIDVNNEDKLNQSSGGYIHTYNICMRTMCNTTP